MKYTYKDLMERAKHTSNATTEWYEIDNHCIALCEVWSHTGGRSRTLVSVIVDGKTIATRCRRDTAINKALQAIS